MKKYHRDPNCYVTQVVLRVEDLERSKEFYRKIMGFHIIEKNKREAALSVDGIHPLIVLVQPQGVIPKLPRRTGLYHYALLLPQRIQLGLFLKHVRDQGYPIIGGSDHGVSEAIYLQDPDDNGIEVYSDIDPSRWSRNGGGIEMTTLPLDDNDLLEITEGSRWEGIPSGTIIGHIHLHLADLEKGKIFYMEGLGFDLVMDMGSALFLSSGGYHHHIGLNIWNGTNAKPLPQNTAGMEYFTVKYPDEEARAKGLERLEQLGYPILEKNHDFYVKDPSENRIKLVV